MKASPSKPTAVSDAADATAQPVADAPPGAGAAAAAPAPQNPAPAGVTPAKSASSQDYEQTTVAAWLAYRAFSAAAQGQAGTGPMPLLALVANDATLVAPAVPGLDAKAAATLALSNYPDLASAIDQTTASADATAIKAGLTTYTLVADPGVPPSASSLALDDGTSTLPPNQAAAFAQLDADLAAAQQAQAAEASQLAQAQASAAQAQQALAAATQQAAAAQAAAVQTQASGCAVSSLDITSAGYNTSGQFPNVFWIVTALGDNPGVTQVDVYPGNWQPAGTILQSFTVGSGLTHGNNVSASEEFMSVGAANAAVQAYMDSGIGVNLVLDGCPGFWGNPFLVKN